MSESGYRTRQRECLEDFFKKNKEQHVTVEDILTYMKEQQYQISKATVYRYLEKLQEQGVLRKYTVEEGKGACYQYVENGSDCHAHYHFKCGRCGKLLHISCHLIDEIKHHVLEEHDFTIDSSKTVFYGICGACKKKGEKDEISSMH